jgi:hypothetical protein
MKVARSPTWDQEQPIGEDFEDRGNRDIRVGDIPGQTANGLKDAERESATVWMSKRRPGRPGHCSDQRL